MLTPNFPLGERATLSSDLLATLTQTYGLDAITTFSDLGGTYNLNLALHTATGHYVARVYRPWITVERLTALQALKRELYALQLPTILPLPTLADATFTLFEERLVELELFLVNNRAYDALPFYLQAATMLGRLHNGLRFVGTNLKLPEPRVANYAPPETLQAWVSYVQQHLHATEPHAVQAQKTCRAAQALLEPILVWWRNHREALPQQLIHGDYGLGNLAFDQREIVGLFDFDFVARRERLFDLAYTAFWMLYRLPIKPLGQNMWNSVRQFVEHYEQASVLPLTDMERFALPIEMARVPIYWIAEAAFLPNPAKVVMHYTQHLALAEHLFKEQGAWQKP